MSIVTTEKRSNYIFVIFTLFLLIKGFFRKLFPSLGEAFYLTSDILLIVLILINLSNNINFEKKRVGAYLCYISLFVAILPAAINSFIDNKNIIIILGIREYLFPPLVFFAGLSFFSVKDNLNRFLTLIKVVGIIAAALGIAVVIFGITSPLFTPIEGHLESHSSEFGEFGYVASIFDSPEKYTYFLLFVLCYTFPSYRSKGFKTLLYCSVILFGLALSGRRVGIVLAICNIIIFFTLVNRNFKVYILLLLFSPILILMYYSIAFTLLQVLATATIPNILYYFGEWLLEDIKTILGINVKMISSNFGQGSPGALNYFENVEFWGVESLISRILYYVGAFGFVIISILLISMIYTLFSRWRQSPTPLLYSSLTFCVSTILWNIKSGNFLVWPEFFYISVAIGISQIGLKASTRAIN